MLKEHFTGSNVQSKDLWVGEWGRGEALLKSLEFQPQAPS